MKRIAFLLAAGGMLLLSGCGSDGIVFNGQAQIEQFPVRKIPVVHYQLPSEVPVTGGGAGFVLDETTMIALTGATFTQLGPAGFDLWAMSLTSTPCTDNDGACGPPPALNIDDLEYAFTNYKTPGPGWKGFPVVEAYTLSFQNQWFLRGVDGTALTSAVPGQAPVIYEGRGFGSMPISIHEIAQATGFSQTLSFGTPYAAQQEIGDPLTFDAFNVPRVATPVNNIVEFQWGGNGTPSGLLAAGWHEPPATNTHIESNLFSLQSCPAPDYFGGGSGINTDGGVYLKAFVDMWLLATGAATGTQGSISPDDTLICSYYLAAIGCHVIGYGIGLVDSSFAVPGVVNNQDDIMNLAVVFDLSAFIAAGKQFQFVVEDLERMQQVSGSTTIGGVTTQHSFMSPGPKSTLPGPGRP